MSTLPAEWTGVISIKPFSLDCRLFSASGKGRDYPLHYVHNDCHTTLPLPEKPSKEKEEVRKDTVDQDLVGAVGSREQFYCPKCQKALKTDEIGRAIETVSGHILVSEAELATLEFKPSKTAVAQYISNDDPALGTVGFSRRLYVMPKPAFLAEYACVYHTLEQSQSFGFIPLLIMKRKPHVALMRPLFIPETIFGAERRVLSIDVFNDTDKLRDPAELPDFYGTLPAINVSELASAIAGAQSSTNGLDPEKCVNPKRRLLKNLLQSVVARSLK